MAARLYLDLNIYHRPFDDQLQARIRLETSAICALFALLESGRHEACWSFVLDYENSRNPVLDRAATITRLSGICKHHVPPDDAIRQKALQLRKLSTLGALDALHLACAEIAGCECFVTCDDRLIKQGHILARGGHIRLICTNPVDLVRGEGSP